MKIIVSLIIWFALAANLQASVEDDFLSDLCYKRSQSDKKEYMLSNEVVPVNDISFRQKMFWQFARCGFPSDLKLLKAYFPEFDREDLFHVENRRTIKKMPLLAYIIATRSVNDMGSGPTQYQQYEKFSWFIENGAKVDSKDSLGATALSYAVFAAWDKAVKQLLDRGASVNVSFDSGSAYTREVFGDRYPLIVGVIGLSKNQSKDYGARLSILENIWAKKPHIPKNLILAFSRLNDARDSRGCFPIAWKSESPTPDPATGIKGDLDKKLLEVLKSLPKLGADMNARNPNGQTLAQEVLECGDWKTAAWLNKEFGISLK